MAGWLAIFCSRKVDVLFRTGLFVNKPDNWICLIKDGVILCLLYNKADAHNIYRRLAWLKKNFLPRWCRSLSCAVMKSKEYRIDFARHIPISKVSTIGWRRYSLRACSRSWQRSTPWKQFWYLVVKYYLLILPAGETNQNTTGTYTIKRSFKESYYQVFLP